MALLRRVTTSVADEHRLTPPDVRDRVVARLDRQHIILRAIDEQAAALRARRRSHG